MASNDYYGGNGQGYHQPQPQYPPQGNYPPQPNYGTSPSHSPYPQPPNYANTPPQQGGGYGPPAVYAPQGQSYPPQPNYGPSPSHSPAPYQPNAPPYPTSHSPVPQPPYNNQSYPGDERDPNAPGAGFDGPGQDGERGLGATLLGGSAGGFLAHKAGGGGIASVLGAVAGAIGANALEHQHKKKKEEKKHRDDYDSNLAYGSSPAVGGLYPGYNQSGYAGSDDGSHHSHHSHHHGHHHKHHRHSSRSRSRSRGLDDESD